MARVLLLTLVFGPDTVSTANMMTDIARGLQDKGHELTVLTTVPHYNPSQEIKRQPAYSATILQPVKRSVEDGVRVIRVLMPQKRQRVWRRALDYALFQGLTTVMGLFSVGKQDVVLVPSPPITLGLTGYLLSRRQGVPFIYNVQELWPDALIRMGVLQDGLLAGILYRVEGFVYREAAAISVIAQTFMEALINKGVPNEKLHFIPNFVDTDWIRPLPKENHFSRSIELHDKFVTLYAGNIGLTQSLEMLVDVARILRDEDSIHILIVGDGAARKDLERAIAESGLPNITLLPFQPPDRVPELYATSDVCLVPLKYGCAKDTIPSKAYTAMAAGRPVIASVEEGTELSALVRDAASGLVVPPESPQDVAAAILQLHANPERRYQLGKNGREFVVERYSR
ncbi:MAG: glycosyltransferase family 4 protein, partial [Deltaproteobacteria bacterium]|nr:glycosyltransferase family 4 protein [Deltaproteobacteria bacterium]